MVDVIDFILTYHTGTMLQTRCYEKFKDTFPDTYQDILDMFDEAAMLGTAAQTVSQCGQSFQRLCKKWQAW
jgi:hypothetical protein